MSHSVIHTFTCPCGQVFTGSIYEYVNVAKDPQLRYIVLAGLLNTSMCPACGRRSVIACPFVYSDPDHHFLAYVHPRSNAPEETRLHILKQLRLVYMHVASTQELQVNDNGNGGRVIEITPAQAREMPPLQVVFGLEQLKQLINALLCPAERLGKLALSTQSRDEAERGQFRTIARKLALDIGCTIEVEEQPNEYTVWLYGARRQIGSLMRELAL